MRWNNHLIAPSKSTTLPRGKPNALYDLPELYNCQSHRMPLNPTEVDEFDDPAFINKVDDISEEFQEFAEIVLSLNGHSSERPKSVSEALEVYFILLDAIEIYS